jgi:hypothetical protein
MLSIINDLQNHYPVAGGGFSDIYLIEGKIVKVLEDGCWSDTIVETVLQKQAADAGLAPQVHGITTKGDEVIVVMDSVPSGFVNLGDDDLVPTLLGELPLTDALDGLTLFCRLIVAGILHADYHTGNWFQGPKGQTMAIDFGLASRVVDASERYLTRAIQTMLPVLQSAGYPGLSNALVESVGDADDMRSAIVGAAHAFLTDQEDS